MAVHKNNIVRQTRSPPNQNGRQPSNVWGSGVPVCPFHEAAISGVCISVLLTSTGAPFWSLMGPNNDVRYDIAPHVWVQ
jgi:hypothetical protein